MSQDPYLGNLCQTEWNMSNFFRQKSPLREADDLKNVAMYPFCNDNTNAVPHDNFYPLPHYAVSEKHSKSSLQTHIRELETALHKQFEQTTYLRNALQATMDENQMLQKTSGIDKQARVELQDDVNKLNTALYKVIQEKNSKHVIMNELVRKNEELSRENAMKISAKRMQELFD